MNDVVVFKTTHDLNDRVGLADVGKELVAESGTFRGPLHESGDVDKLDRGGDQFLRAGDFREHGQARVGHGHDADIRVDRAEGVIGRLRLAGAGDGVEEG